MAMEMLASRVNDVLLRSAIDISHPPIILPMAMAKYNYINSNQIAIDFGAKRPTEIHVRIQLQCVGFNFRSREKRLGMAYNFFNNNPH
jgi:hypothetical protein